MALNETRIDVLRGALKGHVQSSLEVVATLTKLAKTEKDPTNGVHVKLLHAQKKLADRNVTSLDSMPSIRCSSVELGGAVRRDVSQVGDSSKSVSSFRAPCIHLRGTLLFPHR
jgi:hypothetical protein